MQPGASAVTSAGRTTLLVRLRAVDHTPSYHGRTVFIGLKKFFPCPVHAIEGHECIN
jgi:hypothetical protein